MFQIGAIQELGKERSQITTLVAHWKDEAHTQIGRADHHPSSLKVRPICALVLKAHKIYSSELYQFSKIIQFLMFPHYFVSDVETQK